MFVETAANPFSWVEAVTHLGVPGILTLGITVVWRSYQAERIMNIQWQKEAYQHQAAMEQLPMALDRLRTELLQKLDNLHFGAK